jgi:hypothetical protein
MEPGCRIRVRCHKQFRYFPMSLRTRHMRSHLLRRDLRCLLRVRDSIVDFQPLECRGLDRIEVELLGLLAKEIARLRIVVETAGLHLFGPSSDFLRRFRLAALIEPFDNLLVACSLLDLRFEIISPYAFESEKHVIERTIEVILADIPRPRVLGICRWCGPKSRNLRRECVDCAVALSLNLFQ